MDIGYLMNKQQFSEAIALRYNLNLKDCLKTCTCGQKYSANHALVERHLCRTNENCEMQGCADTRRSQFFFQLMNRQKEQSKETKLGWTFLQDQL